MNDHEDSREAFEATFNKRGFGWITLRSGDDYMYPETRSALEHWKAALDWRDSQVCASRWHLSKGAEENPDDGTIVGECSGGQFVVFAPSKIPIYCPGCGRRVKIVEQQTNDQ